MNNREWAERAIRAVCDYPHSDLLETSRQFERDTVRIEDMFAEHEKQVREEVAKAAMLLMEAGEEWLKEVSCHVR